MNPPKPSLSILLMCLVVTQTSWSVVDGFTASRRTSKCIHAMSSDKRPLLATDDDAINGGNYDSVPDPLHADLLSTASVAPPPSEATEPTVNPEATQLKSELLTLVGRLKRGFQATRRDRDQVKDLIVRLSTLNPTSEPASPYYEKNDNQQQGESDTVRTLAGKWTLVYTDAPDILGLDTSRNPFSTTRLGRIGQECSPPFITNVIEWKRPPWAKALPLSGDDDARVLQKVVTSASATPNRPKIVTLKVAGLELVSGSGSSNDNDNNATMSDVPRTIQQEGIVAGLLSSNPIDWKGPWNPPFGKFEVLYLDDDLRIIRTNQNYLAVNQRIQEGEEWF